MDRLILNYNEPFGTDTPNLSIIPDDIVQILQQNENNNIQIVAEHEFEKYFYKRAENGAIERIKFTDNETGASFTREWTREMVEQKEDASRSIDEASPETIPELRLQIEKQNINSSNLEKVIADQRKYMDTMKEEQASMREMLDQLKEHHKDDTPAPSKAKKAA